MATKTINDLTVTTSAATSDLVPIWVAGSAVTRKITKANFLQGAFTGGGTVATGGFTLTVPQSLTAAGRNVGNTFTALQIIDTPTSSLPLGLYLQHIDNGVYSGPILRVGYNNNGSTAAAGCIQMYERDAGISNLWVDASSNLRIHTSPPTSATDTSGTVVGTQTSMAAAKYIANEITPIDEVLASIGAAATAAVRRFTYRSGAFNGEQFEGIVTDLAPRYGMDRDEEHPAGKSLNEITLLGDLLRAVAYLAERVAAIDNEKPAE